MKVLVTGVGGQLGHDMVMELSQRGHQVYGSDLSPEPPAGMTLMNEKGRNPSNLSDNPSDIPSNTPSYIPLDITEEADVTRIISDIHPDAVVHCAAWTAVDAAEDEENRDKVRRINADGTGYIAWACAQVDAKMVYISTDYVFNGRGIEPWEPDCKDYAPLNHYGQTKLEGEQKVAAALSRYFIVRIAWVFGKNGSNFVKTMLRVGKGRDFVTVVDDQIGTPTYTPDLSRLLADMIETDRYGYYHATNSEDRYISWADFTEEIYRQAGYSTRVKRVTTEEYGLSKAVRPFNSRLDKKKLLQEGFAPLPDWKDALARYLKDLG